MISNWSVITKQIKKGKQGFINICNYLEDSNRVSHEYTNIVTLNDARKAIINSVEDRAKHRAKLRLKGARYVNNYATSFVLALPRNIRQPDHRQWGQITDFIITQIARANGIDRAKLKRHCHIVLHDESASPDKPSHINLLVSNVIDKQVIKAFSQKRTTHLVKQAFNRVVELALKESNMNYMPKRENVKNKPLYAARAEKAALTMQLYRKFEQHAKKWLRNVLSAFERKQADVTKMAKDTAQKFDDFDQIAEKSLSNQVFNDLENIEVTAQIKHKLKATPHSKRKRRRRKKKD